MPSEQKPPFPGWKFDKESRGWYSPRYQTFLQAKAHAHRWTPETPHAGWMARRQYDENFGRLKGTTYEAAGKARRVAHVPPDWHQIVNTAHGKTSRTNWYSRRAYSQNQVDSIIASLNPGQRVMVVAYGTPSVTSPRRSNEFQQGKPATRVYRSLHRGGAFFARSYRPSDLDFSRIGALERYEIKVEFP